MYLLKKIKGYFEMEDLRERLDKRVTDVGVPLAFISRETDIGYMSLVNFKNGKQGLGKENFEKLKKYFHEIE